MTPITVPLLGADEAEVRISCWMIDVGESVIEGDRVVELRWPGFTFDVAAPVSGRLTRIERTMEQTVCEGETLGFLEPIPVPR